MVSCATTNVAHGNKHLIAFHGFGQDRSFFHPLADSLSGSYTCYTVDLFYHGHSTRTSCKEAITPDELQGFMEKLLKRHDIQCFSIAGYSLGGKFALALLRLYAKQVDHLILIAPDGIKKNYWYQWATFSSISRKLFKHTIAHPDLFFRLISVFQQSGLLHKRVAKFVANQMKTRQQRQKVYCSWIACRRLEGNLQENIRLVNQYNIPVSLFFGKYDQVMPWKKITPLLKNVHQQQLIILDTGHNTLLNDVAEYYQHHEL